MVNHDKMKRAVAAFAQEPFAAQVQRPHAAQSKGSNAKESIFAKPRGKIYNIIELASFLLLVAF